MTKERINSQYHTLVGAKQIREREKILIEQEANYRNIFQQEMKVPLVYWKEELIHRVGEGKLL